MTHRRRSIGRAAGLFAAAGILACGSAEEGLREPGGAAVNLAETPDLARILRLREPLIRVEQLSRFLQGADYDQLEGIKRTFELAPIDRADLETALFMEWWARFNAAEAFRYAFTGELLAEHPRLRWIAARAWAREDPRAVIDSGTLLNLAMQDGSFDTYLLDAAIVGWSESGKPGLEAFLSGLTKSSDVTRGMRTYARLMINEKGPREALEAMRGESPFPDSHKRLMVAGALTIISHADPALAIEWLPIAEADGIDTRTFEMRIAGGWARFDPEAAFEWIETLPEGKQRDLATRRASDEYYKVDPEGYLAYLDQHRGEAAFDREHSVAIRKLVYASPEEVDFPALIERSQTIVDESTRAQSLIWVLQVWNHLSPIEADAWIQAHEDLLTDGQRASARQLSQGDKRRIDRVVSEIRGAKRVKPLL